MQNKMWKMTVLWDTEGEKWLYYPKQNVKNDCIMRYREWKMTVLCKTECEKWDTEGERVQMCQNFVSCSL